MSNSKFQPTIGLINGILKNVVVKVHPFLSPGYDILAIKKNGEGSFYSYELSMSDAKNPMSIVKWVGDYDKDYETFRSHTCSADARRAVTDLELRMIFAYLYTGDMCNIICQYAQVIFQEAVKAKTDVVHYVLNAPCIVKKMDTVAIRLKIPSCISMVFPDKYVETKPKPTPSQEGGVPAMKFFEDGSTSSPNSVLKKDEWFQHVVLELTVSPVNGGGDDFKVMVDPTYQFSLMPEMVPILGDRMTPTCAKIAGRQFIGGVVEFVKYMRGNGGDCEVLSRERNLVELAMLYGHSLSTANMRMLGKQLVKMVNDMEPTYAHAPQALLDSLVKQGYCLPVGGRTSFCDALVELFQGQSLPGRPHREEYIPVLSSKNVTFRDVYGNVISDNNNNVRKKKKKKSKKKKSRRK